MYICMYIYVYMGIWDTTTDTKLSIQFVPTGMGMCMIIWNIHIYMLIYVYICIYLYICI
jgi:hypothetical protein